MNKVTVVGLGYVGLPSAVIAAESGYFVSGFDIDNHKISQLKRGNSFIEDVESLRIKNLLESGHFQVFNSLSEISETNIYLICVPTPLSKNRMPDLSILLEAVSVVGSNLKANSLVIVESTVEPGTIREQVVPVLEDRSKLSADKFFVAFSPERIDPGSKNWNLSNTPKLVSGLSEKSLQLAINFYSKFVSTIVPCTSLEIAETAKLLENSFRLINISFVNEIMIFCNKLGIPVNEVIEAAATKPYGFMPFYPGIGAGGHCIPVDPIYLSAKANEIAAPTKIISLAEKINLDMPKYFADLARKKINGLSGKKILVIGVAYKANISDVRETPVESLIINLKNGGATVDWHDDLVGEWNGTYSVPIINDYDLAIIATAHDYIDLSKIKDMPVLNTKGAFF